MEPPISELRSPILISVGILKRESIEVNATLFFGFFPRQIFGDPDRFPKKNFILIDFCRYWEAPMGDLEVSDRHKK